MLATDPDPDFDFDFDFDNELTDRQPSPGGDAFSDNLYLEAVRKAHWGTAEGTAAPDRENSRRGAEAQRREGEGLLAKVR